MARTTISSSDADKKRAWEEKLFRDTAVNSYFMGKFTGGSVTKFVEKGGAFESAPKDVIHIKENLLLKGKTKAQEGEKMTFTLIPRIDPTVDAGVTSGQTLKGKELALNKYHFSIELERYRQAVSAGTPLDWHRAMYAMPVESRNALLEWGKDKIDLLCARALEAAPSNIFYKTSDSGPVLVRTGVLATAKSALTAANSKLTPQMVSYMKTWARTGGGRTNAVPLRPLTIDGSPHYVFLTYEDAIFDWKNNSDVMTAHEYALQRGYDNPIFKGASYVWDGVIIHTHEFVTKGTDGGSGSVPYCYGHLLGSQALVWAWGEKPSIVEDTEDYEEDLFFAWRMTAKVSVPSFNNQTFGSISCLVSRTNISGT